MNARVKRMSITWGAVLSLLMSLAAMPVVSAHAQDAPALSIVSPSDGAAITANDIEVEVTLSDFTVDCTQLGRPDQPGFGHILALIDGTTIAQLTNFYCTDTFTVPGDGLTPGEHTLAVVLASNTHVPMMDTAQVVTIDFQPEQPVPLPTSNYIGDPGITLTSPHDGAMVPSSFEVQVEPTNFAPTGSLEGKTNIPGYGHYHVWVDTPEMPSSLAGMVLMPGTNDFTLDLSAWGPGEHTIRIEPAQNDHTMYDPATPVTFTVNVDAAATPAPFASPAASAAGPSADVTTVQMTDQFGFAPEDVTIAAGQSITWINASAIPHTTTGDPAKNPVAQAHPEYAQLPTGAEPWDSGLLQPGESFTRTFTVPGTYVYFCIPHVLSGMLGTITVQG
jgi:plastocyanin